MLNYKQLLDAIEGQARHEILCLLIRAGDTLGVELLDPVSALIDSHVRRAISTYADMTKGVR